MRSNRSARYGTGRSKTLVGVETGREEQSIHGDETRRRIPWPPTELKKLTEFYSPAGKNNEIVLSPVTAEAKDSDSLSGDENYSSDESHEKHHPHKA